MKHHEEVQFLREENKTKNTIIKILTDNISSLTKAKKYDPAQNKPQTTASPKV